AALAANTFLGNQDEMVDADGTLLLTLGSFDVGSELWKFDPAMSELTLVKDILPGAQGSYPLNLVQEDGRLYFRTLTMTNAPELWTSDGTANGTYRIDLPPGTSYIDSQIVASGGRIYFLATDAAHGAELWSSDGTSAGTSMLKDIVTGPGDTF